MRSLARANRLIDELREEVKLLNQKVDYLSRYHPPPSPPTMQELLKYKY